MLLKLNNFKPKPRSKRYVLLSAFRLGSLLSLKSYQYLSNKERHLSSINYRVRALHVNRETKRARGGSFVTYGSI